MTIAAYPANPIGTPYQVQYDVSGHQGGSGVVRCSFEFESTTAPTAGDTMALESKLLFSATGGGGTWTDFATAPRTERKIENAISTHHVRGSVLLLATTLGQTTGYVGLTARLVRTGGAGVVPAGSIRNIVIMVDAYGS